MPNPATGNGYGTNFGSPEGATVQYDLTNEQGLVIFAHGTVNAPTTANVFAPAAMYINTVSGLPFINTGTTASPVFSQGTAANQTLSGTGQLNVAHAIYSFATDGGGAPGLITPALNATIPASAILVGATINSTTAVTSGGTTTISIGTSAGSTAASILAATSKASFTLDALINGVPTFAAPVKMSAAGQITLTSATTAISAGIIEVFVYYTVAANA